jgi:3-phosphoshikimate 1-carboxyvinyltransferase
VYKRQIEGLEKLGVKIESLGTSVIVHGCGLKGFQSPTGTIDCRNSATTIRLLAGAIAASGVNAILDGSSGLRDRPMRRIIDPLERMGVLIDHQDYHAPIGFNQPATSIKAIKYRLPVASAQVKSCLLIAGLSAEGTLILREPAPSRDHTEIMLRSMGVDLGCKFENETRDYVIQMKNRQPLKLTPLVDYISPGDISAASFLIVAGTIVPDSELTLRNVLLNPTRTGLIDILNNMGANIHAMNKRRKHGELVGDIRVRYSRLNGIRIDGPDVVRMIDEFPVFAIAASCAVGVTVVRGAQELRHKESDRISVLCTELQKIGVKIKELEDGFEIIGQEILQGGSVEPHGDHRLAMALAVAGSVSLDPVIVANPEIIDESFPNFQEIFTHVGADMQEVLVN